MSLFSASVSFSALFYMQSRTIFKLSLNCFPFSGNRTKDKKIIRKNLCIKNSFRGKKVRNALNASGFSSPVYSKSLFDYHCGCILGLKQLQKHLNLDFFLRFFVNTFFVFVRNQSKNLNIMVSRVWWGLLKCCFILDENRVKAKLDCRSDEEKKNITFCYQIFLIFEVICFKIIPAWI